MSNLKDRIKNKVRSSAHEHLIDPVHVNVDEDVNVDVDINVNVTKPKRKKFEDRYSRQTVWIDDEIIKVITRLAGNERGEKTRIINEALRQYLKI